MRWQKGRRSGNVIDRRGSPRRRKAAGGGLGLLAIAVVAMLFGVDPRLVLEIGSQLDSGPVQQSAPRSACGFAQSAMGPFYCPGDQQVYIDLGLYNELKNRFGAPGDFAQASVIAHEVGHHVQTLLGISAQVQKAKSRASTVEANAIQVRMELQADLPLRGLG
jgi:predicted metalloprotease